MRAASAIGLLFLLGTAQSVSAVETTPDVDAAIKAILERAGAPDQDGRQVKKEYFFGNDTIGEIRPFVEEWRDASSKGLWLFAGICQPGHYDKPPAHCDGDVWVAVLKKTGQDFRVVALRNSDSPTENNGDPLAAPVIFVNTFYRVAASPAEPAFGVIIHCTLPGFAGNIEFEKTFFYRLAGSKIVRVSKKLLKSTDVPAEPPKADAMPRASFDCAKASSSVEKLICADEKAAALDRELADLFAKTLKKHPGQAKEIRDAQRRWIGERDQACAQAQQADCLVPSYEKRMAELKALSGEP